MIPHFGWGPAFVLGAVVSPTDPLAATAIARRLGVPRRIVAIVEGESLSPDDCSQLGKCSVRNLPPDLPMQTPIEVRFKYEENGRLTVNVQVEGTEKQLNHEITRENSLTQDQLDSWRKYISGVSPTAGSQSGPAAVLDETIDYRPGAKTRTSDEGQHRTPDVDDSSTIKKRWA